MTWKKRTLAILTLLLIVEVGSIAAIYVFGNKENRNDFFSSDFC